MIKSFQNAHIWIIGASSGIGRALAVELASRGAVLALSARRKTELDSLNEELGGRHKVFPVEVTDSTMLEKSARAIAAVFPRIDSTLFMAAAYAPTALDKLEMAVVRKIVDINLYGAFNTVYAVLPILKSQGSGQIVLCGSVSGYRGLPNAQPYSATKAGIINLAESLRSEQQSNGLDIKVINPGFVRTPMTDKNNFRMPMIISAEAAAIKIANGMQKGKFEIDFPKTFTLCLKLLRVLPSPVYFRITRILTPRDTQ